MSDLTEVSRHQMGAGRPAQIIAGKVTESTTTENRNGRFVVTSKRSGVVTVRIAPRDMPPETNTNR